MLDIKLLGKPQIMVDGTPIHLSPILLALLVYLIVEDEPKSREDVRTFFWGEIPTADDNLRQNLKRLNKEFEKIGIRLEDYLDGYHPSDKSPDARPLRFLQKPGVQIDLITHRSHLEEAISAHDVKRLEELVNEDNFTKAFLFGLKLTGKEIVASKFNNYWKNLQQNQINWIRLLALDKLSEHFSEQDDEETELKYLKRMLEIELSVDTENLKDIERAYEQREHAYRRLMQMYSHQGKIKNVKELFEALEQELKDSGASPSSKTAELYQGIISSAFSRHEVSAPRGELIGRQDNLEQITGLLTDGKERLVVVTGPGGIGKNRLAHQIAYDMQWRFEHGACIVDLETAKNERDVISYIAEAIGMGDLRAKDLSKEVKRRLHFKHVLLVLDTFEHVPDALPKIHGLITSCKRLHILITSRTEFLDTFICRLEPLDLPHAIQLFKIHSLEVLDEADDAIVGEICEYLGRLPLCIEIAAPHTRSYTPEKMLQSLKKGFTAWKHLGWSIPDRHRTMYKCVHWSYQQLRSNEKTLLRHLAIFSGCTQEALGDVCQRVIHCYLPNEDHVDQPVETILTNTLTPLILKNLVVKMIVKNHQEQYTRYTLLQPIREYALMYLAIEEEEAVRYAHACCYASFAAEAHKRCFADGDAREQGLAVFKREWANIDAGWTWIQRMKDQGESHAKVFKFNTLLIEYAQATTYLGSLRYNPKEYREKLEMALDAAIAGNRIEARVSIQINLGNAYRAEGDTSKAVTCYEQALELMDQNSPGLSEVFINMGAIKAVQGDFTGAIKDYFRGLKGAFESDNQRSIAVALDNLGDVHLELDAQGDLEIAIGYYEDALKKAIESLDLRIRSRLLYKLGNVYAKQGRVQESHACYDESLALASELED